MPTLKFKPKLLLFCLVYFTTAIFVNPVGEIMSDAVLATTVSIVDKHSLEVSPNQAMDLSYVNGKYYSGVSPGASVLAVPFYLILKPLIAWVPDSYIQSFTPWLAVTPPLKRTKEVYLLQIALVWLVMAPMNATLALLGFQTARKFGQSELTACRTSLIFVFTFAFAYSCMYSRQFLAGAILQIIALINLNLGIRDQKAPIWIPWVSGLWIGICLTLDYSSYVFGAIVFAYLWKIHPRHQQIKLGIATIIPLLALAAFNAHLYGSPFLTPYHFRNWEAHPFYFTYKGMRYLTSSQFQSAKWLGFTFPTPLSTFGLSFSFFKGVFVFCPALVGLTWLLKKRVENLEETQTERTLKKLALGSFLCAFLFNSSLAGEMYWSGVPIYFGPRFLVSTTPLCVLWIFTQKLSRRWNRVLLTLGFFSVAISVMGAMYQDVMLGKGMDDSFLQNPIYQILKDILNHGCRIPVLDVYGIGSVYQNGILMGLVILFALFFFTLKKSQVDPEAPVTDSRILSPR